MTEMCNKNKQFCSFNGFGDQIKIFMDRYVPGGKTFYKDDNSQFYLIPITVFMDMIFFVYLVFTIRAVRKKNQKFFHKIGYIFIFISSFSFLLISVSIKEQTTF